jgi:hypothetical protein
MANVLYGERVARARAPARGGHRGGGSADTCVGCVGSCLDWLRLRRQPRACASRHWRPRRRLGGRARSSPSRSLPWRCASCGRNRAGAAFDAAAEVVRGHEEIARTDREDDEANEYGGRPGQNPGGAPHWSILLRGMKEFETVSTSQRSAWTLVPFARLAVSGQLPHEALEFTWGGHNGVCQRPPSSDALVRPGTHQVRLASVDPRQSGSLSPRSEGSP